MPVVPLGVSHCKDRDHIVSDDEDDPVRKAMEKHPADAVFRMANPVQKWIHAE